MATNEKITYQFNADTKQLESQIGKAEKSSGGLTKTLEKTQSAIEKHSKKIKAVATVGVGLITGMITASKSLGDSWNEITIATGATGKDLEDLKDVAKNVFKTMAVDAKEASQSIGILNTQFGLTGEELEIATSDLIIFSKIAGTELVSTTDSVVTLMKNWNIEASNMGDVLDALAKVTQDTGISVDSLTGLMQRNGGTLRGMGFNYKEASALLGTFTKAGLPAEQMVAGLARANRTWQQNGKDARIEFNKLIKDVKGGNTTEAFKVFGRESATFVEAIQAGKFEFADYAKEVEASSMTVANTWEEMFASGTAAANAEEMKIMANNIQLSLAELGDTIMVLVAPAVQKLSEWLRNLTDWFTSLDDGTKNTIVTVLGLVTGIALALLVFGKIVSIIQIVIGGFQAVISVIGALVGIIGLPWVLAIAGIIAVIAIVFMFRDQIWGAIKWLWARIGDFFNAIGDTAKNAITSIGGFFTGLWNKVTSIFTNIGNFIHDKFTAIKDWAQNTINSIVDFFTGLPGRITGAIGDVLNFLNPFKATANYQPVYVGSNAPFGNGGTHNSTSYTFNVTQSGQLNYSSLVKLENRGAVLSERGAYV